jgi:hypothetical protein
MWGRLDGAEVLMRAVLDKYEGDDKQELIDAVQEEILRDELPEVLAGPEPWKEKLTARVGEGPSPSDLDGRDLAATGLHATAVMRRMLLAAGKAADEGTLLAKARAKALRFAAKGLGLLLSLAYLPAKLFRLS